VAEVSLPVAFEPAPVPTPPPPVEAAPAPRQEPATTHAPQASPADLEQVLKESGLQLVQTKPGAAIDVPAEPEFVPAKRPRRPPPPDLGQPLQIVETRKE
jgi:hypothetical protein